MFCSPAYDLWDENHLLINGKGGNDFPMFNISQLYNFERMETKKFWRRKLQRLGRSNERLFWGKKGGYYYHPARLPAPDRMI